MSVRPKFQILEGVRLYIILKMMKRMVTFPNPAANYYVSVMS